MNKSTLKHILGVAALCAMPLGLPPQPASAQKAEALLQEGRQAFLNYDFPEASRLYSLAKKKLRKADTGLNSQYEQYNRQLTTAENFLDRVEQIVIIDSITVPRQEFFKAYRLPASAGRLSGAEGLPVRGVEAEYVFTNEGGDYKLWAQPDSTGTMRLIESTRLTDGKWSEPAQLPDDLSEDGDEIYPFMMADGVTLYYADNGSNSIGGYDIMVATRDASDGSFMQPQNLGFPYNSPYDDYLLAIDDLNGVGWWATDRNQVDDSLTVYVFIPNDLRKNYDSEEEDVLAYARIDDYIATQPEDSDYTELLTTIRSIDPDAAARKADFHFPMPGGEMYTSYDDFASEKARQLMKRYQASLEAFNDNTATIAKMRKRYSNNRDAALGGKIAAAEKTHEKDRETLRRMRSDIYRFETGEK